MDPGRLLTATALGLLLAAPFAAPAWATDPAGSTPGRMAPVPNPEARGAVARRPSSGPEAIAAANHRARTRSQAGGFEGGLQTFTYGPGRIYEVWTAPLRVTAISLGPDERVVALAAGDTVRWQIGETASGEGPDRRVHVLVKPLARGLETNLLLTTSRRLYVLQLRSGPPEAFNAAVTWDFGPLSPPPPAPAVAPPAAETPSLEGLDAHYRIRPRGRRPAWTPTAVMTDGRRTLIIFPPGLAADEAPALFALGADGEAQMVNYRQQGGLYLVDRVLERAELRLGGPRARAVRLLRLTDARP